MIAEGNSTKEIAAALQVSVKTVETHRSAVMARLGIHDIAGLVMFAARNNLVTIERRED
jgi:DNA-binding NarL/FixJ family response regulator